MGDYLDDLTGERLALHPEDPDDPARVPVPPGGFTVDERDPDGVLLAHHVYDGDGRLVEDWGRFTTQEDHEAELEAEAHARDQAAAREARELADSFVIAQPDDPDVAAALADVSQVTGATRPVELAGSSDASEG